MPPRKKSSDSLPMGERIVALARNHIGEKYILGAMVPKDNANWTGPWDCAEFASWLVFQIAGLLYGCDRDVGDASTADAFTGFWRRDSTSLGTLISIDEAAGTPGAAVLRFPQVGASGHIVISDGQGGTVEAHSPVDGVVALTLKNRRWDTGVLVPGVTYSAASSVTVTPPTAQIFRLMTPVMQGPNVRAIQKALQQAGFDPGAIDGAFGPHTASAVLAFQLSNQLQPDGEVGPETAASLGVTL
jgi:N-acetylmuramoyl-L-alanine amidase